MAGVVGYRKSAWDGATNPQRAFLRAILNALHLGEPVLYDNGSGVEWYIFSDYRIDQGFVENLGWANTALSLITTEPDRGYVVPVGADALTVAASAQGNTAWFKAASRVPAGWFPVVP